MTEEVSSYELIRDKIIELFNPPDGDEAEEWILELALTKVCHFVESQPCTCKPDSVDEKEWADPCERCKVLGRRMDRREER